jgi:multidrug resistance efflux pump
MLAWMAIALTFVASMTASLLLYRGTSLTRKDAKQASEDAKAKASRDEVRQAFETARDLYQAGIAEAARRIENCNRRVAALEADVEAARVREQALRRWIRKLEDALRREGIETPNGEPP